MTAAASSYWEDYLNKANKITNFPTSKPSPKTGWKICDETLKYTFVDALHPTEIHSLSYFAE